MALHLTEVLSDDVAQPCSSTPTSSGTLPPPPPPPPLLPNKPQPGVKIKQKAQDVKQPYVDETFDGRAPCKHTLEMRTPPEDKKSGRKGFKNIFRKK